MDLSVAPEQLREVAPGIFYTDRPLVILDAGIVAFLKREATSNAVKRARVCAHPEPQADQHDMLIASHRDTYVAPHRHLSKSESFIIVEGTATLLLFSEDGRDVERVPMGAAGSGRPFFYRMPARQYHSLAFESEVLVFAESTKGPFVKADMETAPWAPGPADSEAGRAFIAAQLVR